jgi:hypothetical protein
MRIGLKSQSTTVPEDSYLTSPQLKPMPQTYGQI